MRINEYARQLSQAEIDAKEHRELVGGLWEEVGALQFEYLKGEVFCRRIDCSISVAARCAEGCISFATWIRAITTEWTSTLR